MVNSAVLEQGKVQKGKSSGKVENSEGQEKNNGLWGSEEQLYTSEEAVALYGILDGPSSYTIWINDFEISSKQGKKFSVGNKEFEIVTVDAREVVLRCPGCEEISLRVGQSYNPRTKKISNTVVN
ncbi:MAG: hypothetical protein LBF72_03745 [Holosporales bacterium]|jgi:hypothetical protein|nr:hypothetical protein [Holosporales bacterium]